MVLFPLRKTAGQQHQVCASTSSFSRGRACPCRLSSPPTSLSGHRSWLNVCFFFPESTQLHGNLSCSICCIGVALPASSYISMKIVQYVDVFLCVWGGGQWASHPFTSPFWFLFDFFFRLTECPFVAVYFHNMKILCFYRTSIYLQLPIYFLIYVDCIITLIDPSFNILVFIQ